MIRPQLRPDEDEFKKIVARAQSNDDNDSGGNNAASGGKGGGKSVDINTLAGREAVINSQKDGKMGYGYYDSMTGKYVPWYIDMINGGGANQAGDEFVSPFPKASLPALMTSIANDVPMITPYGSQRERQYAPAGGQRTALDPEAYLKGLSNITGGGGNGGNNGGGTQPVPPVQNIPGPILAGHNVPVHVPGPILAGHDAPVPRTPPPNPSYSDLPGPMLAGHLLPPITNSAYKPAPTPPAEQNEVAIGNTAIVDPNTPVPSTNKTVEMMRKALTDSGIQNNYLSDDMVRDLYKLVKKKK